MCLSRRKSEKHCLNSDFPGEDCTLPLGISFSAASPPPEYAEALSGYGVLVVGWVLLLSGADCRNVTLSLWPGSGFPPARE